MKFKGEGLKKYYKYYPFKMFLFALFVLFIACLINGFGRIFLVGYLGFAYMTVTCSSHTVVKGGSMLWKFLPNYHPSPRICK